MNLEFTDESMKWVGCDDALIGITINIQPRLIYDRDLLIEVMIRKFDFTEEDAWDYMCHSMITQIHGDKHPLIMVSDHDHIKEHTKVS